MNSSANGSSASASSGGAAAPAVAVGVAPKLARAASGDSCTWYAGQTCNMPRTCYDCINVPVQKEECAVAPNGMCVSMDLYREYAPRQKGASASLGMKGFFPAANFTYCSMSDSMCASCKLKWRDEFWSTNKAPAPAMCRGDDGCFCLSNCELPNRVETIVMGSCSYLGFDQAKLVQSAYIGAGVFAMMVVFFMVFKSWANKRHMRDRERAEEERRERRERRLEQQRERTMRTGPALALGGWNSLRDKLLESEREGLERGGQRTLAGVGVVGGAPASASTAAAPSTPPPSSAGGRTDGGDDDDGAPRRIREL